MRLKNFLFFVLFSTSSLFSMAQSIKGVVRNPVDESVLPNVNLSISSVTDTTLVSYATSSIKGVFSFANIKQGSYLLKATYVGFEPFTQVVNVAGANINLGDIFLPKSVTDLEGVTIVVSKPAASQKADTLIYNASQFKTNPDATVEDLVKKMPGTTVDRSGNVTQQGEQIKKVTVDGKEFFGNDATMALRNLPAEVVDKIQFFDKMSDQAQLTGFDDGNSSRAINIVTKSGIKNGQFGRLFAGYGTDDRYTAGGNVSFFKKDRRISLVGNFNNINIQNFAQQDLMGAMSGGGGRGGGRGFGGGGFGGGQSAGISQTNALGINYNDKWGKKLTVSGSYFFTHSDNVNQSETFSPTVTKDGKRLNFNYDRNSTNKNLNHRINFRFEYQIDSNNTLMFMPSWSFQNSKSTSQNYTSAIYDTGDSSYISDANSRSNRDGYNISNNLIYRHSFAAKRGRMFSASLQQTLSKNDGVSFNLTDIEKFESVNLPSVRDQYRTTPSISNNYSARLTFNEPVGKNGTMEFSYNPSIEFRESNQKTYDYDGSNYTQFNQGQSNKFENKILKHELGISYRLGRSRDNQFSAGLNYQNSTMESERIYPIEGTVNAKFNAVLPNLRWSKKISKYSSINVFYRARTSFPGIDQLQDIVDSSSVTSIVKGNPNLKQSYTHFGNARYTYTNTKTSQSFIVNMQYQAANNYITTDVENNKGITNTTYVNLNGYNNFSTFASFTQPVKFIKSNLSFTGNYNTSKTPSRYNGETGFVNRNTYGGGAIITSNVSEYVDFTVKYDISYTGTKSTLNNGSQGQNFVQQTPSVSLNLLSPNGLFFQTSFDYQYFNVSGGENTNFSLWNAAIGKKFLKKKQAELKLSVFDILKQNNSFSQTVNQYNLIETTTTRVLQQYFMLTFTYSLKNFGKAPASNNSERGGGMFRPGMGGPGGGGFGGH